MEAFLAQLADIGGPAFLLLLMFRFFPQFRALGGLINDAASWTKAKVRNFASRTIVKITRPIWYVILPVMLVATIVSTVTHGYYDEGDWRFFATSLVVKLIALGWAGWIAYRVSRVKHIDQNDVWIQDPARTQDEINGKYGKAWLFVPMIVAAFWSLAILTSAMLLDTFVLADQVSFYHSMFMATQFVLMLVFTLGFALVVGTALHAVAAVGIDLGGGTWNTLATPLITIATPLITATNNARLAVTPEARERLKASIHGLLVDNRFLGGLIAAWILWFMSFHGPLAWVIELGIIIVLVSILFTYVWIIRKNILRAAEWIVIAVCTLGGIMFAWRLIDAAVPGPHPVMFYERFASVFGWFGGDTGSGLGCFIAGVPRASLLLVGLIAMVIGWLASRTDGKRSRILFLVAALVGLPVVGIVTARAMTPDGYLCAAPAASTTETTGSHVASAPSPAPSALGPTVIAGTHPPARVCSYLSHAHNSACPGSGRVR